MPQTDPNVLNLPIATVEGQTTDNYTYSQAQINTVISDLPFIYNTPTQINTYTRDGATKGKIYTLSQFQNNEQSSYGPWIEYDSSTQTSYLNLYYKIQNYTVSGDINPGPPSNTFTIDNTNNKLIIQTNLLPPHTVGNFPISKTSPCYTYDPNNNTVQPQNVTFTLPLKPVYSDTPQPCSLGLEGYFFDNTGFFVCLDENAYDALSLECEDSYWGHPEEQGLYHHHTTPLALTNNTLDTKVRVVGFAIDGFPIVAPYLVKRDDGSFSPLSTNDLDECHGLKKNISFVFQGQTLTYSYFYVTSFDFPYLICALRGTIIGTYTNN